MKFADKMQVFDMNIFSKLEDKKAEIAKTAGVINLPVGTPDFQAGRSCDRSVKRSCGRCG